MGGNDEVDCWREEYYFKLKDCKMAMIGDHAMSRAYNSHTLKEFIEQLIGTNGLKNVSHILSNTICETAWDGRYSSDVKEWANRYPAIRQPPGERKEPMHFSALLMDEHPVILNQAARIVMQKEKELLNTNRKEPER